MKKWFGLAAVLTLGLAWVMPAVAADFSFHGDLNHRFKYTNHADFAVADQKGVLHDGDVDDNYGEIKYRMWVEAATDDGNVKGVFAIEVGGLRFGESGKMTYSGDTITTETRWAYVDFQLPGVENKARFKVGLIPFTVNPYVWQETVGGVEFDGSAGPVDYSLAWARGWEVDLKNSDENDERSDVDAFFGRLNFKLGEAGKLGIFGLYQTYDADAAGPAEYGAITSQNWEVKQFQDMVGLDLYTLGVDGGIKTGPLFVNWDLMYQGGNIEDMAFTDYASGAGRTDDSFDVSAYFAHADVGVAMGKSKLTYTFWYASGDDDPTDGDFNAFIATDIDRAESITLQEGNYADDDYFTERSYILDKGMIMNKLAFDFQATDAVKLGAGVLYMLTAEDIVYTDNSGGTQKNDELGWELQGYVSYMMYKSLEVALNAGYLFSGDAMDFFEVPEIRDGNADEDIFVTSGRIRFKF